MRNIYYFPLTEILRGNKLKTIMRIACKFCFLVVILSFFYSCKSVSDKSSDLLAGLMDELKPVFLDAKRQSQSGNFNREKKAEYIKRLNRAFQSFLDKNQDKYLQLEKAFNALSENKKMNASVEFNNYYYDPSEDGREDDDDNEGQENTRVSFYELITEHRTLVSIDSQRYDDMRQTITLKRFEITVLSELLKTFQGGDFNVYVTFTIDNILQAMLMKNFQKYKEIEDNRLKAMRNALGAEKYQQMIEDRARKQIEQTKGLLAVFVKRYIRKDLSEILGENFERLPVDRIKAACVKIINDSKALVDKLTPEFEKEKAELDKYRLVYQAEYPKFEHLVARWRKLNPIFNFSNSRRTIN